jgi:acyl-CoA synthetase (NDP forming)
LVKEIINKSQRKGRKVLTEYESYRVFDEIGIPFAPFRFCKDKQEILKAVDELGFPVAAKVVSPDILHKTDAGCIKLGIRDNEELVTVYEELLQNAKSYKSDADIHGILLQKMLPPGIETIIGIKKDPQFGHIILFGLGGIFVEVFEDISIRRVPITRMDAEEMINEIKGKKVLRGIREKKQRDIDGIIDCLMKLSSFVKQYPEIEELDINPLFVYEQGKGVISADALIIIE